MQRCYRTVKLSWKGVHPVYLSLPFPLTSLSSPVTACFSSCFRTIVLILIHLWPSCKSICLLSTALLQKSFLSDIAHLPSKYNSTHNQGLLIQPSSVLTSSGEASLTLSVTLTSFTRFDESKKQQFVTWRLFLLLWRSCNSQSNVLSLLAALCAL